MTSLKKLSKLLILALMFIALYVFSGVVQSQNMWMYIAIYWLVLVFKNLVDFLSKE